MGKGGRDGGMRGEEIDSKDVKRKGGQIVKIGELKVVRWRDRRYGSIACKSVECVRPTESGVVLNIEPHRLLSDVWVKCGCVCVCVSLS